MTGASTKPESGETSRGELGRQEDPAGGVAAEMALCCGPGMAKMMEGCACGSAMKGHWRMALLAFILVFLAFLISQVGGILGMIAFFRIF